MGLEIDFMRSYERDSIVAELQRVAGVTGRRTVTMRDLREHARVCGRTVTKKFGTLGKANEAAGLVPRPIRRWTTEELLKVVTDLWVRTLEDRGRSPVFDDVRIYKLPLSADVIAKRFGTWKKALIAASDASDLQMPGQPQRTARRRSAISARTRFIVFKRDLYQCQICRRSGVELELDHVRPVSLGGTDEIGNLQTLCVPCNRGKSDSMQ